jgi:hypothetical protein
VSGASLTAVPSLGTVLRSVTERMLDDMELTGWWTTRDGRSGLVLDERPVAWDINCGECETWAEMAASLTGGKALWLDTILDVDPDETDLLVNHCVLVLDGRYYDSQHPDGVDDVRDLDYMRGVKRVDWIANNVPAKEQG